MSRSLRIDLGAAEGPGRAGRPFSRRRRNRHGRGLRGNLMLPNVPGARTRAERFEDLVAESVERLEQMWGTRVSAISFSVALVPDRRLLDKGTAEGRGVPVGATSTGTKRGGPAAVVFRRPVEELVHHPAQLPDAVHDTVVELVGELLAMPPEDVDPSYGGWLDR